MTASSQTPPGALPPELSPVRQPMPVPDAVRAAYAAYDVVLPVPAGCPAEQTPASADVPAHLVVHAPEPQLPQCITCGTGLGNTKLYPAPSGGRYPSGAQVLYCGTCVPDASPVQAAAGVITAAMEHGHTAPAEIADAEQAAGILFDPKRAKDIEDAAREQAHAEYKAELTERGRQLALMTDHARNLRTALADRRGRLDAVLRLCEGRPVTHHLPVAALLDAAANSRTPYDSAPMTLSWKRSASVPQAGAGNQAAIVECESVYGGRADLVLSGEERLALASLLDMEVRDINAECPTDGCGTDNDLDVSDPSLFGWSRLQVAHTDEPARWYCSDRCVFDALARAGHELTEDDHRAELDGDL